MTDETTTRTRQRPNAHGDDSSVTWRLHVLSAPDSIAAGTAVTLQPGATVAGRRPEGEATLAFDDGTMSRSHVAFVTVPAADRLEVRDLDSHNGTWVDSRRVARASVASGQVVRFGDVVAVVEADDGTAPDHAVGTAAVPGASVAARRIRAAITAAAAGDRPALILGETGTGKESAAAAMHDQSGRAGRLVRLNVSAVPASLFEAELFGHSRGAFSGASEARLGRVREAQEGTLVLDEIGELPMDLQPKLLRLLEERSLRPVGGSADVPVDCRFVAATNVDPEAAVDEGRLRRDLLARLRHHEIHLPPLRHRRPEWLAGADAVAPLDSVSWAERLDADAVEALVLWPWPDNLRGLSRVLSALTSAGREPIGLAALPEEIRQAVSTQGGSAAGEAPDPDVPDAAIPPPRGALAPDATQMRALLSEHRGNVGAVARALGRDRKQVYRWLRAAGISEEELAAFRR